MKYSVFLLLAAPAAAQFPFNNMFGGSGGFGGHDMFGQRRSPFAEQPRRQYNPCLDNRAPLANTKFNIQESANAFTITSMLPDVQRNDVNLSTEDGNLVLSASRAPLPGCPKTDQHEARHVLSKEWQLPHPLIQDQDLAASFRNGQLTIQVPKSPSPASLLQAQGNSHHKDTGAVDARAQELERQREVEQQQQRQRDLEQQRLLEQQQRQRLLEQQRQAQQAEYDAKLRRQRELQEAQRQAEAQAQYNDKLRKQREQQVLFARQQQQEQAEAQAHASREQVHKEALLRQQQEELVQRSRTQATPSTQATPNTKKTAAPTKSQLLFAAPEPPLAKSAKASPVFISSGIEISEEDIDEVVQKKTGARNGYSYRGEFKAY